MSNFIPSAHQQAIFTYIEEGAGSLMVQAAAGAGKTTTIVQAMKRIRGSAIYLVFAKRNQEEAEERLKGSTVKARTMNSLGNQALGKVLGRTTLKANKVYLCWRNVGDALRISREDSQRLYPAIRQLVELAPQEGVGILCPDQPDTWFRLMDTHGIQVLDPAGRDESRRVAALASKTLAEGVTMAKRQKVIDFGDQLYLSIHPDFAARFEVFDWVFVDEVQDLSPVQVEIVACLAARTRPTRFVFVGDRWQAIYGWRGAMTSAMDDIKERFNCAELPLSVCWRCDTAIVALAASYGAPIEPAPGKAPGQVITHEDGPFAVPDGVTVLCRVTAPLVRGCFSLLRQGRPAVVLGKDIGANMVALVKAQREDEIPAMRDKLGAWAAREIEDARADGRDTKISSIEDKVAAIDVMIEGLPGDATVADLCDAIHALFADDDPATAARRVTFSTIHKAKGLEWDTVVWLDPERTCGGTAGWQAQQELHCKYVAATRARHTLHLVPSAALALPQAA